MKRRHLVELEDLPWWPALFRDACTDYLVTAIRLTKVYSCAVPRLASALSRTNAAQIIDLCSGGGGPWPQLLPAIRAESVDISLCLTDKYPNAEALDKLVSDLAMARYESESVSALNVPSRLNGFRTLFSSFHHFQPADAKAILASAVDARQGIAVFEATSRTPASLALMFTAPLAVWLMTPMVRPFRWSRLFWTYLIPVVPLAVLFDGVVSCLRVYTPREMLDMALEVESVEYDWETGTDKPPGSPIAIPYLIGVPRNTVERTAETDGTPLPRLEEEERYPTASVASRSVGRTEPDGSIAACYTYRNRRASDSQPS